MEMLKLVALDEEDLQVLSAHLQDAVLKVSDLQYLAREKRFLLTANRFVWEEARPKFLRKPSYQRRRTALHFNRVSMAKATGINRQNQDDVLSLLTIRFIPGQTPAGTIELTFSANAAIRLDVECIEAQLTDLGAAWETESLPRHNV
ncbi:MULTISPECIES: DUF2948 family protein [Brucella]|uniref:DUF2948 family protein n=15 Tax=Brucella TaxID=234 RepID=Q2YPB7_BRUA2|nr:MULTISPECIES: DUF2948 family protein [Brucella]EPZ76169.1 hypothetical protein M798_01770 [Brucella melitensis ADMAS-G1]ERT85747.1 hypothetical protein P050_00923 [Brucella abortus 90-12178]ERT99135.1 hypothetical protein P038_01987 [Brucella abortus 99-9971-135]ERU11447.1 hypothetical protein P039_00143 [Brucella abortus 07-0994-2411]EXU84755.1 hypothetical protein AX23_04315 [Brucella melitensis 548]KEX98595.1 hypothetical protein IL60_0211550 [Brucella inopinata BO1]KFH23448.1 hypothet